ncbi:hypothetical protein EUGRSUZ_J00087 [Eucalyptus grandis]|uniref:Uncharacterized protein n=2 Tax=Eucalyptus grandis TaxID=71139 RepID=A0A059A865_EUCGR|nr:hypothetical protein EUGRSUZ_J00087 [Eucalyptus grandis]
MGVCKRPTARYGRSNLRCFRKRYVGDQVLMAYGDWREEAYQKLKSMRESYMPELNEMYEKISRKLQQHKSLPQQPKPELLEKLKAFRTMLERVIAILQFNRADIVPLVPSFKEKLVHYEKQIINFINTSRSRKVAMQQGQPPPPHMHSS